MRHIVQLSSIASWCILKSNLVCWLLVLANLNNLYVCVVVILHIDISYMYCKAIIFSFRSEITKHATEHYSKFYYFINCSDYKTILISLGTNFNILIII